MSDARPLGLYDMARALLVDPFEVVRLLVLADAFPTGELVFTEEHLTQVRETGGIESWWVEDVPGDAQGLVLAMVGHLVSKGCVGDQGTRIDNLWRGLDAEQQGLAQQAINVLAQNGQILSFMTPRGVQVSLATDAVDYLSRVAAGEARHDQLAVLWG